MSYLISILINIQTVHQNSPYKKNKMVLCQMDISETFLTLN